MKNPSPHHPLVYIVWHDAYANAAWMTPDEYREWMNPEFMENHEVGWLIDRFKNVVVLASRFNPTSGQYGGFQLIPETWCKITVLAKPTPIPPSA